MRSRICLLVSLCLVIACDKQNSNGSAAPRQESAKQPAEPQVDPAEVERQRVAAEEQKVKAAAAKKERQQKVAELEAKLAELRKANSEEAAKLPDRAKLRGRLTGMIRDAAHARSICNTKSRRFEELKKVVAGTATAEIKSLQEQLDAAEKGYYAALSGVKEERLALALGIVEETQVQKEITALRAIKEEWFNATRETRRGSASSAVRSDASNGFRTWVNGETLRKAVVGMALPDGKTPDTYDYAELDFYLLLEILEDSLDRKNFADEKKTISENDKKLVAMEHAIDALREQIAEKMMAGGGEMEEFTEISEHLPAQLHSAESLERSLAQMREVYNEIEATLERQAAAEAALEAAIEQQRR